MKKILAVILCLLITCTAFACLAFAEGETTTKDPYETAIPQVITNIAGGNSADHQQDLYNGFKFMRIVTENLTRFVQDAAKAFDRLAEWLKTFTVESLFGNLAGIIK